MSKLHDIHRKAEALREQVEKTLQLPKLAKWKGGAVDKCSGCGRPLWENQEPVYQEPPAPPPPPPAPTVQPARRQQPREGAMSQLF